MLKRKRILNWIDFKTGGTPTPDPTSAPTKQATLAYPRPVHLEVFPDIIEVNFRETMTAGLDLLGCTDDSFLAMINKGKLSRSALKASKAIATRYSLILEKSFPVSNELDKAQKELSEAKVLRKTLSRYPVSAQRQADKEIAEVKKKIALLIKTAKKIDREYQITYKELHVIKFVFIYFELCEHEALKSGVLHIPQPMYHFGCSHTILDVWHGENPYYSLGRYATVHRKAPLVAI